MLLQTAVAFNKACQIVLNYGSHHKTYNKNVLNRETYRQVRTKVPHLPSALVQTARDEASEMLKRTNFASITKKRFSIRYDNRTFKFYPDSNYVSLTTVAGRLNFTFKHYSYMDRWRGEYTNAQLIARGKRVFINVQVKLPDAPAHTDEPHFLGMDRGIMNIAVCSDNTFYNSKHLRAVKGRYQYLRRKLQHTGTRSAKRHLRKLSGRERRFCAGVNHCISKVVVNKPYNVFVMEKLGIRKRKSNGHHLNSKLSTWSFAELQRFINYKAEQLGKQIIFINPRYTSQRCSRCGFTDRRNRHGSTFYCRNCSFQLNADLNASRNIGTLGRSEYLRRCVNPPIVASVEPMPTGMMNDSYKPIPSGVGS